VNVVDSCGWLEYFADGPNAGFFLPAIVDTERLLVPSICLLEVFKRVLQQRDEDAALQAVAVMQQAQVVELNADLALTAAKLGIEHKLPLADSIILATGRHHGAQIWTQDADFEGIDGVRYVRKNAVSP
jgi:predicted nucleic acid-binding protein